MGRYPCKKKTPFQPVLVLRSSSCLEDGAGGLTLFDRIVLMEPRYERAQQEEREKNAACLAEPDEDDGR
jgi:hypothetical protein